MKNLPSWEVFWFSKHSYSLNIIDIMWNYSKINMTCELLLQAHWQADTHSLQHWRSSMQFQVTVSDTAILRLGPLHLKWRPASPRTVLLTLLASIVIYVALFVWYANTAISHTYPTDHTNFWFGLLHGYFAVPSFIVSWFTSDVTIYQAPNNGFWYNLGFLLGLGGLLSSARSSD